MARHQLADASPRRHRQGLAQGKIGGIVSQVPPTIAPSADRRPYIDWARGLAVLIMIEAHALDAWSRPSIRRTQLYYDLNMLGGFAAPLFLWLAGIALVLAAERRLARGTSRRAASEAIVRRGAIIFILAFLFRLQAFIVSPGSWPITIFRVDILNIMGPSIAATGIVWGLSRTRTQAMAWCAAVAAAIAVTTPPIRQAAWVDALPLWLQWHLRPFGDHTTFTLFPWAGFVFGGAVCGVFLSGVASRGRDMRAHVIVFVGGLLLVAVGFYTATLPSIYRESSFWTSSPTYFAIRTGTMMAVLAVAYFGAPFFSRLKPLASVLEKFGANSLFVYWIHVELVYGYATWPLHNRLPPAGFVIAYVTFCAAMFGAIRLKDRIVAAWRAPRASGRQTSVVPA